MDAAPTSTPRRIAGVLAVVAIGAAAALFLWWRLGPVTRGTVWAEDGRVFLGERFSLGSVGSLLHPYEGYLHLVPRLVVDVAGALPAADYARVVAAASCMVVGGAVATVFVLARDVVPAAPLRLPLVLVPVLLPLAPYEIAGNTANLHWFLLAAAPWCFAHRARTWWGSAAVALVTLCIVLTEPQAVYFLPLLLLAWVPVRDASDARAPLRDASGARVWSRDASGARAWSRAVPVTVVAVLGLGVQIVTALTTHRDTNPGTPTFPDVLAGWVLQVFAGAWDRDVAAAVRVQVASGWWPLAVPLALLVAVVAVAVVVAPWRARWMIVVLVLVSGGVWWAALITNAVVVPWARPTSVLEAVPPLRYAAAAGMLLLAALVVSASVLVAWRGRSDARAGSGRRRTGGAVPVLASVAGWCVVALVVIAAVGNAAPATTRRSVGPVWGEEVPAAVASCDGDPARTVGIRTAPAVLWVAEVPCAWLLRR